MKDWKQWDGFEGRQWKEEINVRDFIQKNYTPYDGDESFLEGATEATDKLWGILQGLQKEERAKGGVLDMDTDIVSGITSHGAGYLGEDTKELEQVVGLHDFDPPQQNEGVTEEEQVETMFNAPVFSTVKELARWLMITVAGQLSARTMVCGKTFRMNPRAVQKMPSIFNVCTQPLDEQGQAKPCPCRYTRKCPDSTVKCDYGERYCKNCYNG